MALALLAQLAMWEHVVPPVLHQGSWQSCGAEERVLEHHHNGVLLWELHLGPENEFALYRAAHDGDDDDHDGAANLLAPDYRVTAEGTWRGKRQWNIPSLGLWISIVAAGGSRNECESFYIRIESTKGRPTK